MNTSNKANSNQNYFKSANIKNNSMFRNLRSGIFDFDNAPVYSTFLMIILVLNLGFFIFTFFSTRMKISTEVKDSIPLYFGAINKSAIMYGYQFWRFLTFAFIENSNGINLLFVGFFVFLTFCRIGYHTEITFGSKNTAIIWIFGIVSLGLLHFGISKFERLYFFGTQYLSLLSVGALFFYWIMQITNSEQQNQQIRNLIWQTLLLAITMIIINYVYKSKFIADNFDLTKTLSGFRSWTVLTPMIVVSIGFFVPAILMHKQYESWLLFWISVGFCAVIIVIGLSMTIYVYVSEFNLIQENTVWKELKDKFWNRIYK